VENSESLDRLFIGMIGISFNACWSRCAFHVTYCSLLKTALSSSPWGYVRGEGGNTKDVIVVVVVVVAIVVILVVVVVVVDNDEEEEEEHNGSQQ